MVVAWLWKCIYGPRLYRIYKTAEREGKIYEPNCLEAYTDNIIRSVSFALSFAWSFGAYASPVVIAVLYRRGYVSVEGASSFSRLISVVLVIWAGTWCLRGIGRLANADYKRFLMALDVSKKNTQDKRALQAFDGDFFAWPVDFRWNEAMDGDKTKTRVQLPQRFPPPKDIIGQVKNLPVDLLGYLCIHSFGRRMIYPGAVGLLQAALGPMLLQGRAKLVEEHSGTRYKLLTRDGNEIDTMFVDQRKQSQSRSAVYGPANGKTLVLCCEGNAGFYEVGIMATPIDAGYSVLGWNHPGFAGSTGIPFPDQEHNAVDVVMQFAIHRLGFKPENIIVFAWSIGAYSASWLAMNYPEIKGLILDATFDDIIPLATSKMPPAIRGVVEKTVGDYFNLNNGEHVNRYDGPLLLYRRTKDEIISTDLNNPVLSNRGNDLLMNVLRRRYPRILNNETEWVLREWLSGDGTHQKILYDEQGVNDALCEQTLRSYASQHGPRFPMDVGSDLSNDERIRFILFLARKHMIDFNSTHCVPLPASRFQEPWDFRGGAQQSSSATKTSAAKL